MTVDRCDPTSLDALADLLAPTFPCGDDAPLALALLRALAQGSPVDVGDLARILGRDEGDVLGLVGGWPNVHRDQDGRVVAFSGLSIVATPHRFAVGDQDLYTWCVWDALFLPALLGQPARVESTCPITSTAVRLTVKPDGVHDHKPEDLWVSFPPPERTSTADITGSFCCQVHFLAGEAVAARWRAGHEDGSTLPLADAFELGRRATRAFNLSGAGRAG